MKKPRDIKTLLMIMREYIIKDIDPDHPEEMMSSGMCIIIGILENKRKIYAAERRMLFDFLVQNRPKRVNLIDRDDDGYAYFWPSHWYRPSLRKPRLQWLTRQINILKGLI